MKITKENAKELLPIVKALAEGKKIQDKIEGVTGWCDTDEINLEFDGQKILHRIKPDPKCRPFKNQKDCLDEMHKHPDFGWLVNINTKNLHHVSEIYHDGLHLGDNTSLSFTAAFSYYEFPDGSTFGMIEE